jgi:hypothetical protein
MNAAFEWSPFLSLQIIAGLGCLGAFVFLAARIRRAPDFAWRAVFLLLLTFLLLNPVILNEVRQGLADKLLIVVDESASQKIGGRDKTTTEALDYLTQSLQKIPGIEPIIIHSASDVAPVKGESTNLFTTLRNSLPGIPLSQVAGTVLITDGQVHDVPATLGPLEKLAPFHVILTGKRNEFDRKVTIVSAPKYGLLSQDIKISVKVEEFGRTGSTPVPLTVSQDGTKAQEISIVPGEARDFTFKLSHSGQNVFEFSTPAEDGELTAANNTAPVIVNGIRDRLRVLLVSGAPHMGERAWRNLLKSDPSVDLVHFTILRSTTSMDMTPPAELSLIVFPVEELFQRKLKDFDLIIFDRYQQVSLLTQTYFTNIAAYIKQGGAFLMAMGSDEPNDSVFNTALADILPVDLKPDGVVKKAYTPQLTDAGKKHPVTADLQRIYEKKPWGQWFTQAAVSPEKGETLMTGADGLPLLVVNKVTDGRVAVLASDNIWLWSKGDATQGPYTQLMRNVAHWLMKEPELEDDYIKAEARGNTITVAQRELSAGPHSVLMTTPSGAKQPVDLTVKADGWVSASIDAAQNGIYSFEAGNRKAFVVVGTASNEEFSDVHTTEDKLRPIVEKTRGGTLWFQKTPAFTIKSLPASAGSFGGDGWIGLKRNAAYSVRSVESRDVVPGPLALLMILVGLILSWWRESGMRP